MKVIAMMPARNEAWVLAHSLDSLSRFCDVILVSDRSSDDATREICRRYEKVLVLDAPPESRIREQRWQLLDAARQYDGANLLWSNDADELVSPRLMNAFLDRHRGELVAGTVVECRFYTLWNDRSTYRDDDSHYRPYWNRLGFVDDRRADYLRTDRLALHEPRTPAPERAPAVRAELLPMLHLQWMIPARNQMKQAWYRCREWLDGRKSAADINRFYAVTFPAPRAKLARVPAEWVADLTFPGAAADRERSWHERQLLEWFDEHGIERFEPLEIWHIARLRAEFVRRTGRQPRPDRSYVPPWRTRTLQLARRAIRAVRRRLPV